MPENSPNQDSSSFEPVRLETLMALEDAITDSPYVSGLNPRHQRDPFLELELENKDSSGGNVAIFVEGKWVLWFSEEVTVYKIDLSDNFTPEGWQNTSYLIIRNDDGDMFAARQASLINDQDFLSFSRSLHKALREGDEESLAEVYDEALKQEQSIIEKAKALEIEHELGLTQVSEQEIKELINFIKSGHPASSSS